MPTDRILVVHNFGAFLVDIKIIIFRLQLQGKAVSKVPC